ncbi:hypothetical protein OG895_03255 [Streptomyces sp. NBC_00201]|uniref:hypothetical protein n=1 Tax=unclassified Streptomyces TaxID=2593676 RepID=UPI002253DACE|nr:hypothetical protein [Streptomyces sp. NBC_00201]MCX5244269.1 hypothetical protein [Streptomyces sp. NBC_00201]
MSESMRPDRQRPGEGMGRTGTGTVLVDVLAGWLPAAPAEEPAGLPVPLCAAAPVADRTGTNAPLELPSRVIWRLRHHRGRSRSCPRPFGALPERRPPASAAACHPSPEVVV